MTEALCVHCQQPVGAHVCPPVTTWTPEGEPPPEPDGDLRPGAPLPESALPDGAWGASMKVPECYGEYDAVSVRSGLTSDPGTWGGVVPPDGARVKVYVDHIVTLDGVSPRWPLLIVDGVFRHPRDVDWELRVGTLLVLSGGEWDVSTGERPQQAGTRGVVTWLDVPIDTVADPEQMGGGPLLYGKVRLHGMAIPRPWMATAVEPLAGDTFVMLSEEATGWQVGDEILVPDTHQLRGSELPSMYGGYTDYLQVETRTITAVDGAFVYFAEPLRWHHEGGRDSRGVLRYLPDVANLSRNLVWRAEHGAATVTRPHCIASHGADLDIRYVRLEYVGRTTVHPSDSATFDFTGTCTHVGTNQGGRYGIHLHHYGGNPANEYLFVLQGNAVLHCPLWAVTIHDAHFGLVRDNVVWDSNGACYITQQGNETGVKFQRNFGCRSYGYADREGKGREGGIFWFRGPLVEVEDNVGYNAQGGSADVAYGYKWWQAHLGVQQVPMSKDMVHHRVPTDMYTLPVKSFKRNRAWSCESGLTYWWLQSDFETPKGTEWSIFEDFAIIHCYNKALFNYQCDLVWCLRWVQCSQRPGEDAAAGQQGVDFGDYFANRWKMTDSEIHGRVVGIGGSPKFKGTLEVARCWFVCQVIFRIQTPWVVSATAESLASLSREFRCEDVIYQHVWINRVEYGGASTDVLLQGAPADASADWRVRDVFLSMNHNGVEGDHREFFRAPQRADALMIESRVSPTQTIVGTETAQSTNAWNVEHHGYCTGGRLMNGSATVNSTAHAEFMQTMVAPMCSTDYWPLDGTIGRRRTLRRRLGIDSAVSKCGGRHD